MPLSEWKEYKLSDLCSIKGGKRLPKGSLLTSSPNNHPYIKVKDMSSSKYVRLNNDFEYVNEETQKIIKNYIVNAEDVILSIVGTIGLVSIIDKSLNKANLTENCVKLIDLKNLDNNFLYYYLFSDFGQNEIKRGTVGAVQAKLPIYSIGDINITLPPLSEQQAIAEVLGSLDDKIELNRQMNKTLEDMAQAIFKSWFVDFDPVKAKAEGRTIEGLSQEILDLFPDSFEDSELGEIPKGWSIYEFDDILEITSSKRIFMSDYVSEGIPFYRSKEIIEKQKGNNVSTELFITKQKYNEIKDKFSVPKVGDILLTSVGTLGVSYLVKNSDEFYFKDGNLTWFKNYTKTFPEIIYYWLRSSMGQSRLEEISIGSTQKALTIASMKKINIILPSVEIQKELNMTFKIIRDNIDFHNDQIETLSTMRDTLLPKLISGELRIPDAEKLLEGTI